MFSNGAWFRGPMGSRYLHREKKIHQCHAKFRYSPLCSDSWRIMCCSTWKSRWYVWVLHGTANGVLWRKDRTFFVAIKKSLLWGLIPWGLNTITTSFVCSHTQSQTSSRHWKMTHKINTRTKWHVVERSLRFSLYPTTSHFVHVLMLVTRYRNKSFC